MATAVARRPSSPFIGLAGHVLHSRPTSSCSTNSSDNCCSPNKTGDLGISVHSTCNGHQAVLRSTPLVTNATINNGISVRSTCSGHQAVLRSTPLVTNATTNDSEVALSSLAGPACIDTDNTHNVTKTRAKSQRRRRHISSGLVVNTVGVNGKSAKDCYSLVCGELGWKEIDLEVRGSVTKKDNTIFCVMQTQDMLERLPRIGNNSWVSRYVGCPELCEKGNFARMCHAVRDLCDPEELAWNPKTWVLPDQYADFKAKLEKTKKTFIVKPEDGSQGDGIFLVRGVRDLDVKMSAGCRSAVAQQYIDKPLLLRGMKFDLRMYVCLIGGSEESPPRAFLCREGLARFCTEKYEEPAQSNMHKCMSHLTNYSLNKRSDKFEHAGTDIESVFDPESIASKRPLTAALTQMEMECPGFDRGEFYDKVVAVVLKSIAMMGPALTAFSRNHGGGEMRSFQILGFDIILGRDYTPYLLEINNSPSLCIDECLPLEPDTLSAEQLAVPIGRTREKNKVCRCMDMAQPHFHQQALVDVVVKKVAVGGAFMLLEQLKEGLEDLAQDDYIPVVVSGDPLFESLSAIEGLFHRCGGAQKAFTSAALRRNLGHLCKNGALEKHDLDTLSQKFRFTKFGSHDPATRPEALRLFDFIELLRLAGARAFPGIDPSEVLERIVQTI